MKYNNNAKDQMKISTKGKSSYQDYIYKIIHISRTCIKDFLILYYIFTINVNTNV